MGERITLRRGDVIQETVQRCNSEGEPISDGRVFLARVADVNREGYSNIRKGERRYYITFDHEVSKEGVPGSMTVYLDGNEVKQNVLGRRAEIDSEFTTDGGILKHTIRRTSAPRGTRWSYDR